MADHEDAPQALDALTAAGDARRDGARTFLVECYWPGVTVRRLLLALARSRRHASELDNGVAYRGAVFVQEDDTAFVLFGASSADAVRAVGARAGLPFERVVEAALFGIGDVHSEMRT